MPTLTDPAVIFARSHRLPSGALIRLRLARPGDQVLLGALLSRLGYDPSEPELLSLVRFDPHCRAVICATALVDGGPRVLGFGAIELDAPRAPATVVVDPEHALEITQLLRQALEARAQARTANG